MSLEPAEVDPVAALLLEGLERSRVALGKAHEFLARVDGVQSLSSGNSHAYASSQPFVSFIERKQLRLEVLVVVLKPLQLTPYNPHLVIQQLAQRIANDAH